MKYTTIKQYLSPYSIYGKRSTTINHAFASALAPCDSYNVTRIIEALRLLGQDVNSDLVCVYCGFEAETWDHLVGLVKDLELHGFGHQLGNLVPCCKTCNSKKGNRDWQNFLRSRVTDDEEYSLREQRIMSYLNHFATEIDLSRAKLHDVEWQRYSEIKRDILSLMREADLLAETLRVAVAG